MVDKAFEAPRIMSAVARSLRSAGHPPAQTQQSQALAQALEAVVGRHPPDREELVYDKLFNTFGLHRERSHEMTGLRARLAARVALHNFCIWLNEQLGRPRLAFADLLQWRAQLTPSV